VLQACGVTGFNPAEAYVKVEVVGGPRTFDAWWLEDPVRLDLPKARIETSVKVKKSGGGYRHEVTIRSRDHFACFVGIVPPDAECRFDDNFIHVEPGGEAKITFFSSRTISNRALQIRGYNTGR